MLNLRTPVSIKHDGRLKSGTIIGRSYDNPIRYEIKLDANGDSVQNIPEEDVEELGAEASPNCTGGVTD